MGESIRQTPMPICGVTLWHAVADLRALTSPRPTHVPDKQGVSPLTPSVTSAAGLGAILLWDYTNSQGGARFGTSPVEVAQRLGIASGNLSQLPDQPARKKIEIERAAQNAGA